MTIGEYIIPLLAASPAFVTLCGTRIFPLRAKQDAALPRVVYGEVDRIPINDLNGRTGLTKFRVQFDCYAERYLDAHSVAQTIHTVFDSRNDNPCSSFVVGRDLYDDESELYRVSLDFLFWFREA